MTNEAAAEFVQTQRSVLDAEVREETSVYLQAPLQLCSIAISHNLLSDAQELCKQTWELTTGFGHRKDPTLNNTVEAICYLTDVAADDARRLLSRIAPQIYHVLDYTDGKGTRHVISQADRLLAKLKPSALLAKYEEHTNAGDWSLAEDSLQAYVEQGAKEGWSLEALMRTGLQSEIRDTLQKLAGEGYVNAENQLRILQDHNGWDLGILQREEHAETRDETKHYDGNVADFGPEQLDDLLESLSDISYEERETQIRAWYQYWDTNGQRKRLIEGLEGLLLSEEGRHTDVLHLSDLAFHSKRKQSGSNAAWKYLVFAQILKGGWHGYMENIDKICDRFDLVFKYYPNRCDEFVEQTTYSMFSDPIRQRIAPNELVVYFYVRQGRIEEAVKFAETMVNCVIDDTRTLPLDQPLWGIELVSPSDASDQ